MIFTHCAKKLPVLPFNPVLYDSTVTQNSTKCRLLSILCNTQQLILVYYD